MINKVLRQLVQKYLNGTASVEEREVLERYYLLFAEEPDVLAQLDEQQLAELSVRIRSRVPVPGLTQTEAVVIPTRNPWITRVAVAASVLAVLSLGWWFLGNRMQSDYRMDVIAGQGVTENRFQLLPDSTRVVLQPGSRISYQLRNGVREVTLTGEGWFDVARRADQHFVIRSGKVKTTVLGTAFTIRAWPEENDVTVSVIRGRVRVEDEDLKRTPVVLEAEQQLVYALAQPKPAVALPRVKNEADWVRQDMTFDNIPLGELAGKLERRYEVRITLANPALADCAITGRFNGTETLEEVMNVLAATSGMTYRLDGDRVELSGDGCN